MDFTNEFSVDAPLEKVWTFMLQAEEVAPCVPGASITEKIDSTHFRGTVKLKLGAVQMSYRGELEMRPDEAASTITLQARGSETRGGGAASGQFVTLLRGRDDGGTDVHIDSHLDITGRVATFGRGIMQDVSNRLIKEFAACLESKLQFAAVPDGALAASEVPGTVDVPKPPASVQPQEVLTSPVGARQVSAPHPEPELKIGKLMGDLARGRIAAGLRALANVVEPK